MSRHLTGLFLGAGASFDVGMPLVWDLTQKIKNWLTPEKLRGFNEGWKRQGGGVSNSIIEELINVMSRDDLHYESILGYLEVQSKRHGGRSEGYHTMYSWMVEMVYMQLYLQHVSGSQFILEHLDLYRGISALYENNTPLWVFSLNHDSIVEMIAKKLSIPLYSGFTDELVELPRRDAAGKVIGTLLAESISKAELDNGCMRFPNPPKPGVYLLKIHGSLDIFVNNDNFDLVKILPQGDKPEAVIDSLRAANEELVYVELRAPGGKAKALNEIAYADFDGEMQFLRRTLLSGAQKFNEQSSQVLPKSMLKHFKSNINFVRELICVGYGFGDLHINEIMKSWLEFSADRSIKIVSPGARSIPSFLLHLAPQVELVPSGATEFFDQIAGIKRSEKELLAKSIFLASRRLGPVKGAEALKSFEASEHDRHLAAVAEMVLSVKDGEDLESILKRTEGIVASEIETSRRLLQHLESMS
ncbi:hypothetical protein ACQKPT_26020 [Pseudomonas monteilii]|uniref:hypothetical protein n=1 Tax=Pseudomonas monteilii TaxID=76759 RepID=UPI003D05E2A1